MSTQRNRSKLQQQAKEGPLVPDSTLYRALQHVARSIARRLIAGNSEAKEGDGGGNNLLDRSKYKTD